MVNPLIEKTNTVFKDTGGFNGLVAIIAAILILVIALFFLQQNWIKKEWTTIKTEIAAKKEENEKKKEIKFVRKKGVSVMDESPLDQDVASNFLDKQKKTALDINKMIKKGDLHFEYEQYADAASVYEKLTSRKKSFEGSDKVYNRLAECYFNMEDFERAKKAYNKVYNDYLNSPYKLNSQLGLGKCLVMLGEYDEARRILYFLVGQEAKYDEIKDKDMVIEAYYKIADSYIEQAKVNSNTGSSIN